MEQLKLLGEVKIQKRDRNSQKGMMKRKLDKEIYEKGEISKDKEKIDPPVNLSRQKAL